MCYDTVMRFRHFSLILLGLSLAGCSWSLQRQPTITNTNNRSNVVEEFEAQTEALGNNLDLENQIASLFSAQPVTGQDITYPIANYTTARTKKTFGQYIPADGSDRFSGYHTGDDIEVTDITVEVPVYVVHTAQIVNKQTVSGYGGVVVLEFTYNNIVYHALYGHLDLNSVTAKVGDTVAGGTQLGNLGDDRSDETDGERKHLHFGLYPYTGVELYAGYVTDDTDLVSWVNPSDFLRSAGAVAPN